MMSRYKSGKIPKIFKIIPTLKNWMEILLLTNPSEWTPNATYQATKIFISGLSPKMSEFYLRKILLKKIRVDIKDNKKLNSHYYDSLIKSIYKPAAFFKGIVLEICDCPESNLREASIIASVISKISIPLLHSAAVILRLTSKNYSGTRAIILKSLLDKKYALPSRVIFSLKKYFISSKFDNHLPPVLWQQCFLIFVQRYKCEFSIDDQDEVIGLTKKYHHEEISNEIIREIRNISME